MKKHISKRLLSIVLAVLLIVATIPFSSATTVFAAATDDQIAALKAQITAYTQKMNGSVYTNMKSAYDAYVNAYKLYDAAYYGNNTVQASAVTSATSALQTAINNMAAWSAPTVTSPTYTYTNAVPTYDETTRTGFTRNIVYSDTPTVDGGYKKEGFIFKFALPKHAVFLYDGGELRMPVMLAAHNDGGFLGNDRYALGFMINANVDKSTEDSPYFKFNQVWFGHYEIKKSGGPSSLSDFNWEQAYARTVEDNTPGYDSASFATISADNRGMKQPTNNGHKWWEYANYMRYTGADQPWNNGLQDIKFSFTGESMRDTTVWSTAFDMHYYFEGGGANYYAEYYVIDYSKVASSLGTAAASYLNFGYQPAQYNPDGSVRRPESVSHYYLNHELDNLLTYMENLQFDPTANFTASNYASKAADYASTITTNVNAIEGITSIDEQTLGYQTLRTKMYMTDTANTDKANARETYNAGNSNPQVWTAATWSPFSAAYSDAKEMFDDVATGAYSEGSDAETLAGTVETTYKALKAVADFSPIDAAIETVQNKAMAHKDDNNDYRYKKSVLDALVAELGDSTKYPYLNKTAAERVTYDLDSNSAIAAEASTIAALADSMLDLNSQVDVSALVTAVNNAKDIVNNADPDAYQGIEEATAALNNYNEGSFITNVVVPGTCEVSSVSPEASVYEDQASLDEDIAPFLELAPRQYTVTLNGTAYGTYAYGSVVNIDSPSGENVDWEYSYVSATSNTDGAVQSSVIADQPSVSIVIRGNTTLYTKAKDKWSTIAITYMSSLGKVYAVEYVPSGVTVNPEEQGHPNYSGYRFTNYNTDAFTATENTTVVARYEPISVETYSIAIVNGLADGVFGNPTNKRIEQIPYNTRMEFSADALYQSEYDTYYDEDTGEEYDRSFLAYYKGGKYKTDDYTEIEPSEAAPIPETISEGAEEDYAWGEELYAISMVPEENYSVWRYQKNVSPGRRNAVTDDGTGYKTYDTTAAPNTEKLLAVGPSLDHVWYAQQNCYIVLYTKEQFEDAIKANVFEGIDPDADPEKVVAAYGYNQTTRITDESNGEKNKIALRGSGVVIPDNAEFVEAGILFRFLKDATSEQRNTISNTELTLPKVGTNGINRVKISEANITRIKYNTGHQFAMNFATKASKYTSGSSLDIKYRVYVNYKLNGDSKVYTAYSEDIMPDTYEF